MNYTQEHLNGGVIDAILSYVNTFFSFADEARKDTALEKQISDTIESRRKAVKYLEKTRDTVESNIENDKLWYERQEATSNTLKFSLIAAGAIFLIGSITYKK